MKNASVFTSCKKMINCVVLALTITLCSSISVFAVSAVSEEQAMTHLTNYVYGQMSVEEYTLDEGGSVKGTDLFEGNSTSGWDLKEDVFNSLSSSAQSRVVEDIAYYSNEAVDLEDKAPGVEDSTVTVWWKQLQTKQGVGSKFMTEILKNTKPDFVAANQIWEPFAGPVGIAMGVIAVALMSLLGLVIVSDIAYITLPPVRMLVNESRDNGRGGKGSSKSLIFSYDAMHAVQLAEDGSGQGESRQALGIYFKRRAFMLILLGICLMYLVNGQLYTLVGYILDIVSGFLGF